jgi:hypothetical protein
MEKAIIVKLHKDFEQSVYKEENTGMEFWLARDLQNLLGYTKWENFAKVIEKAKTACKTSGFEPSDHFPDIRKMVRFDHFAYARKMVNPNPREDIKKVERRLIVEQKKLNKAEPLD